MQICVLCKVVDNFGDIGVVWRLCKKIKKENPDVVINLVVDDLDSFSKICSSVQINQKYQNINSINIYNWKEEQFCHAAFSEGDGEKMPFILECFQCGRPDWMEKILFEEKLERTVHIIMIDYLTAEKYADDFHCLQSLTRSAKVQKINFMPGFTEKTGGLIIDDLWKELKPRNQNGNVLVFTYERDWSPLVRSLFESNLKNKEVLVAQGRGQQSFVESWENVTSQINGGNLLLKKLDFMNQEEWDLMMQECSILIIRGEESMSRACLSGIPFVWHAYPQSDEYQLVKMNALLERMKRHFSDSLFEIVQKVWTDFNSPESDVSNDDFILDCKRFINHADSLTPCFADFALSLRKNGDLCHNLMTFIEKKYIIN